MSTSTPLMDRRTPMDDDRTSGASEVLATHDRYADAQKVVDTLSDRGFPVEHTAIVGSDLRMVEDVTGRKRYGRAALEGAGSGAMTGLLIGLFLSIFTLWETVVSWFGVVSTWTVLGAVVGAALGMLTHAMHRGRRDFSSEARLVPGRFEVMVTQDRIEEARSTAGLRHTDTTHTDTTTAADTPRDTSPGSDTTTSTVATPTDTPRSDGTTRRETR